MIQSPYHNDPLHGDVSVRRALDYVYLRCRHALKQHFCHLISALGVILMLYRAFTCLPPM